MTKGPKKTEQSFGLMSNKHRSLVNRIKAVEPNRITQWYYNVWAMLYSTEPLSRFYENVVRIDGKPVATYVKKREADDE